jgi:hypothetical protein
MLLQQVTNHEGESPPLGLGDQCGLFVVAQSQQLFGEPAIASRQRLRDQSRILLGRPAMATSESQGTSPGCAPERMGLGEVIR